MPSSSSIHSELTSSLPSRMIEQRMANPRGNPKNLRPWYPGQSGNPLGRSVARAELDNTFITALLDDFKMHGATAIEKCRQKHVAAYLGIIARTLPKELAVEVTRNDALQEMQHVHGILERFNFQKR